MAAKRNLHAADGVAEPIGELDHARRGICRVHGLGLGVSGDDGQSCRRPGIVVSVKLTGLAAPAMEATPVSVSAMLALLLSLTASGYHVTSKVKVVLVLAPSPSFAVIVTE
jgi:hypothetical protein